MEKIVKKKLWKESIEIYIKRFEIFIVKMSLKLKARLRYL